jgi:hypothetical protein
MKKKGMGVLILSLATLFLPSCVYFRPSGPCFGVGCPAHTPGESGQYKKGEAPKAQNASAQPAGQPAANSQVANAANAPQVANPQTATQQSKQGRFTAFLRQSKEQLKAWF